MTDPDQVIARSQELLERVKLQFAEGPSFLREYMRPQSHATSVPFAPSAVALDEGHLVQSVGGGIPEPPESPTRPALGTEDAQRRLREFFQSRVSALERKQDSRMSITSLPNIDLPVGPERQQEVEEEDEEEKDLLGDQKPILDLPYVITRDVTTAAIPEVPVLSPANVQYPIRTDDAPLLAEQNLSEDGLWVPDLPMVKPENAKRLECRLLWQDPQKEMFFGSDYLLRTDTPPLSQIPPPFPIEPMQHDGRGVQFSKATEWGIEDIAISRDLKIELLNVKFLVHPLSVAENLLTTKLRQLYAAYTKGHEFSRERYYKDRIEALRNEIENEPTREKEYLGKIIECHELKDTEEQRMRTIRDLLASTWRELRDVRATNPTISTLVLKWQSRKFTAEDKDKQETEYENELRLRATEMSRFNELNDAGPLDIQQTIRELRERSLEMGLWKPGDPLWKPILADSAEVTPLEECPPAEQTRRENIGKARVYLKVLVDKREVQRTPLISLDQAFRGQIDWGLPMKITQIPQRVSVELWETGYFRGERFLANVVLPITVGPSPEYGAYEFTSDVANADGQLAMGTIGARCFIIADPNADIMIRCPDQQSQKTKRRLAADPSSFMSVAKLIEWAESHDPNDPYMASMLSTVIAQRTQERVSGKFRLDPHSDITTFASLAPTTIAHQLQQHMAKLREQDEETKKKALASDTTDKEEDYIAKLRNQTIVQGTKVTQRLAITDVVIEAPIPRVPAFFGWIREIMSMYRPLKPIRTPRITTANVEAYSRIIFRMVRAMNVPERTKAGIGPGTAATLTYSSTTSNTANVFARVSFEKETRLTRRVSGANAEWNDPFEFQVSKNRDEVISLGDLAKTNIRVDVFDEISFTVIEDDREQQTKHELIENRLLGTIEIPVSSIWATGKLNGTYSMVIPPFQLGYTTKGEPMRVSIYATLDPPIVIPDKNMELSSAETEDVILRAHSWIAKMNELTVNSPRRILLMAAPTGGKPIVACRMVKKQAPPPGVVTPNHMLRFVSMIPNVSDADVWDTTGDVWCTSQEFLDLNAGDEEEHALLLCNYLKAFGADAYVVLGFDWLNGTTAFVITKEAGRVTLYDPLTGRVWSHRDRFCSLYNVGIVFNDENVWANIQSQTEPYIIDWNLHDPKKWSPFFGLGFPKPPLESPQENELRYKPTDEGRARRLEREIDNAIKMGVEKWRNHQRTSWNPQFGDRLRSALESCERAAVEDPNKNLGDIVDGLTSSFQNYRMTGGPFCMSFTSIEGIVREVQLREVWKTEAPNCDFALAVRVVPYPNDIMVVWVMMAAMQYIQEARPPL